MPLWVSEDSSQMKLDDAILLQEDVLFLREFVCLCRMCYCQVYGLDKDTICSGLVS